MCLNVILLKYSYYNNKYLVINFVKIIAKLMRINCRPILSDFIIYCCVRFWLIFDEINFAISR